MLVQRWRRLLPERERPGKRTALDHALIPAPRRVDQKVEMPAASEIRAKTAPVSLVALVIASETWSQKWKLGGVDGPAGAKHREAGVGQRDRHSASHAAARARDEGDRHVSSFRITPTTTP